MYLKCFGKYPQINVFNVHVYFFVKFDEINVPTEMKIGFFYPPTCIIQDAISKGMGRRGEGEFSNQKIVSLYIQ